MDEIVDDGVVAFLCSVCSHPNVGEIDSLLAPQGGGTRGGTSVRAVAGQFGLSRSAVDRHRRRHLSLEGIGTALSEAGIDRRFDPLEVHAALTGLAGRLEALVSINARTPQRATSLANLSRELRACLEAIARLQSDPALLRAAHAEQLAAELQDGVFTAVLTAWDAVLFRRLDQLEPGLAAAARALHGEILDALGDGGLDPARFYSPAWERFVAERDQARIDAFEHAVRVEVARRTTRPRLALPAGAA